MPSEKKFKVLLVCTGNTCRSPMAGGILKKLLEERGSNQIEVDSAGIASYSGSPASLFAVDICRNFGIDISQHSSRQLTKEMALEADLILVMAPEHLEYVVKLDRDLEEKAFLLKAFPGQAKNNSNYVIRDPIGGEQQAYLRCFFDLDENLRRILPHLLKQADKHE
jgi:protein-tyrosine-phosphatase